MGCTECGVGSKPGHGSRELLFNCDCHMRKMEEWKKGIDASMVLAAGVEGICVSGRSCYRL